MGCVSLSLIIFLMELLTLKEKHSLSRQEADMENLCLFGTFTKESKSTSAVLISQRVLLFFRADFPSWKAIIQNHNSRFVQSVLLAVTIIHLPSSCELEFPVCPLPVQSEPQQIYRWYTELNEIWQFHHGVVSLFFLACGISNINELET